MLEKQLFPDPQHVSEEIDELNPLGFSQLSSADLAAAGPKLRELRILGDHPADTFLRLAWMQPEWPDRGTGAGRAGEASRQAVVPNRRP